MLPFAFVITRMFPFAFVIIKMLSFAFVIIRMLFFAFVIIRMLLLYNLVTVRPPVQQHFAYRASRVSVLAPRKASSATKLPTAKRKLPRAELSVAYPTCPGSRRAGSAPEFHESNGIGTRSSPQKHRSSSSKPHHH